ncbi:hypothetical protein D3C75_500260 [compost metagenome]
MYNLVLRYALHPEFEFQPVGFFVPRQYSLGSVGVGGNSGFDGGGGIYLKQRLQKRNRMIEKIIFPFFIAHNIAAFCPDKGFMLHQPENPPLSFPVTHQDYLAAPAAAVLLQRINHNASILELQAGKQPVPYPVEIQPRLELSLDNPAGNSFGNLHAAQLFEPGNNLLHERLHLLRRNGKPILACGCQHPLQLRQSAAFLWPQLQQPAAGQYQTVILKHCNLCHTLDIQPVAFPGRLVKGEVERRRLSGQLQLLHNQITLLQIGGGGCEQCRKQCFPEYRRNCKHTVSAHSAGLRSIGIHAGPVQLFIG